MLPIRLPQLLHLIVYQLGDSSHVVRDITLQLLEVAEGAVLCLLTPG